MFVPKGIFKAIRINNTPSCAGVTVLGAAFLSAALLHTAGGVLGAPGGLPVRNGWVCTPVCLSLSSSPHGRGCCVNTCVWGQCRHLDCRGARAGVVRAARGAGSSRRGAMLVSALAGLPRLGALPAGRGGAARTQHGSLSAWVFL